MPNIINLDALIPEQQYVVLDGTQHEIQFASVEIYMRVIKDRERMKHSSEEVDQMTQAVDLITMCCPTIEPQRLGKLPLRALMALADIIQEQMRGDDAEAVTEDGETLDPNDP